VEHFAEHVLSGTDLARPEIGVQIPELGDLLFVRWRRHACPLRWASQPTSGAHAERRRSVYGSAGVERAEAPCGALAVGRRHGASTGRGRIGCSCFTVAQEGEMAGGGFKKNRAGGVLP